MKKYTLFILKNYQFNFRFNDDLQVLLRISIGDWALPLGISIGVKEFKLHIFFIRIIFDWYPLAIF
jgi:hypothetical protein